MNTGKGSLLLRNATLICALMLANHISAQMFTVLHDFTYTNGTEPGGFVLSGNTLYGAAAWGGGDSFSGTLFKVSTDGTGFTTLHSFSRIFLTAAPPYINSDGAIPGARLISGSTLYGTCGYGGSSGWGTVFAINVDGTGFKTLHSFAYGDGAIPNVPLVFSGNTLYGTTSDGGSGGQGTVFKLNTDGSGFTNLHIFSGGMDGGDPHAGLILSGNTLFGTAFRAGTTGNGTVFTLKIDGTGFTTLHSFTGIDGSSPEGGLILSS